MFGRLVAPKDAAMIAYAQLEVLGFLPSLQVRRDTTKYNKPL
jgi:hypothetical protein